MWYSTLEFLGNSGFKKLLCHPVSGSVSNTFQNIKFQNKTHWTHWNLLHQDPTSTWIPKTSWTYLPQLKNTVWFDLGRNENNKNKNWIEKNWMIESSTRVCYQYIQDCVIFCLRFTKILSGLQDIRLWHIYWQVLNFLFCIVNVYMGIFVREYQMSKA